MLPGRLILLLRPGIRPPHPLRLHPRFTSTTSSTASPASSSTIAVAAAAAASSPLPLRLHQRFTAPIIRAVRWYGRCQLRIPWKTQLATSFVINFLSDVNAQLLFPPPPGTSGANEGYDFYRTFRMVFTGLLFAIPGNEWYTRISKIWTRYPKIVAVSLRVLASQLIFSPFFLIGFFSVQAGLEGGGWDGAVGRVKARLMGAWGDSLKFWPIVGAVNFWFIPLEFRALVGGAAGLCWGTWLSYLNSRGAVGEVKVEVRERIVELEEKAVKDVEAVKETVKEVKKTVKSIKDDTVN
ncbi:hypothetical protein EX30DRAFT_367977 [Ascodesmis nigricans]|uniref:Uncharacterized protein n=1 Tax=Ascodesmis nigricans TaxID=341454 RepID=A0A4S2N697_9PEZI|nr:hypothetical protein EX30DRAFT_367977 [Ascodesmis nigricans]